MNQTGYYGHGVDNLTRVPPCGEDQDAVTTGNGRRVIEGSSTPAAAPGLQNTQSTGAKPKRKGSGSFVDRKPKSPSDNDNMNETKITELMENLNFNPKDPPVIGTGLIYDEAMLEHRCLWDDLNPECPERLSESWKKCQEYGLIDRCIRIPPRTATEEEIKLQHSSSYINIVKSSEFLNLEELEKLASKYEDVCFNNSTYKLALMAAGSSIELVEQVIKRKVRNGMALIRPPGHHASRSEACGFCFFNNVAIATKYALDTLGLERILIVDWDVHHGQGTQEMFYNNPKVLYFSIHRYEDGAFWPKLRESNYDYIGQGDGMGYNINIPLNEVSMGNSEYMAIFHQLLIPIAYEYNPQLVIISCGYDAAIGCPEGEMEVTPHCYAHFIHMLSGLADGKLCVILEGGYCLQTLSEGVALTLRCLLGDSCPSLGQVSALNDSAVESVLNAIHVLRPYWNCLKFQGPFSWETDYIYRFNHEPTITFQGELFRPCVYPTRGYSEINYGEKQLNDPDLMTRIEDILSSIKLTKADYQTCIAYDPVMMQHKNHVTPSHPECPERLSQIFEKLKEYGILDRCLAVPTRKATVEELSLIHSSAYIDEIQKTRETKPRDLYKLQEKFDSVYLCQETCDCAMIAVGCTLNVVDYVLQGKAENGIAIVRPPGHHAEVDIACGFCIFNTVAIAAKYAQQSHNIKRVLIIDWDIHHGNGIQNIFYEDPNVLYISLHRYDKGSFFPGSPNGNNDKVGKINGLGFNINIPWNKKGMGNADYLAAFFQIILPIAYEFDPELILVSSGFDAARGDPLGGYEVSPEGFAHMTHLLRSLANGHLILVLEGGYNLTSISECLALCTKVLLGDPLPSLHPQYPSEAAVITITSTLNSHQNYWGCLQFYVNLPGEESEDNLAALSQIPLSYLPLHTLPEQEEEQDQEAERPPSESVDMTKILEELAQLSVSREQSRHYASHQIVRDNTQDSQETQGPRMPPDGASADEELDVSILANISSNQTS